MAFKIGGTTVIDNSSIHISGTGNNPYATPTGFRNNAGSDVGDLIRYTTYTDDLATNCRGYLPNGNCAGNGYWNPPNGNWWTWGVSGVPTTNCGNVMNAQGNANCQSAFYAVSVNLVYDGYYELYNRVRGSEQHRNYSNCNCNSGYNTVGNCYNNCNCNCNC